jgi:multidrug efflux system outer membrane protein
VLEAQESLYSSEDELVRSQRDAATNLISLYKALGGGWDSHAGMAGLSEKGSKR